MKILFLHPEDEAMRGAWARRGWDRVIDLGMAGPETYRRWSELFQCQVEGAGFSRAESKPVREALAAGWGYVCDGHGVDWWEVISITYAQRLYQIAALQEIAATIDPGDEVFVSRAGFQQRVIELMLGRAVTCLAQKNRAAQRVRHFYDRARRLSYAQVRQIVWDKYDPEHRVRAGFSPAKARREGPVVLCPSAYVNVSRMALAYAETVPDCRFLMVAARRSGWMESLPGNVAQADLAPYMGRARDQREFDGLIADWRRARPVIETNRLLRVLSQTGAFDAWEKSLRQWLVIRDAWIEVFESEEVRAVLCCDDANPYTHIPLLIAKQRGVATVFTHHGALDGHYLVKRSYADTVLAKGAMERDYLVRRCGLDREQVQVGAPPRKASAAVKGGQTSIIFFSEDYEVSGGRVEEFYRDVVPGLAKLARENGKELVIKLHPAENMRDRQRIVDRLVSGELRSVIRMVDGPLTEELLEEAWFAVTVISTTAVDCASRGIPVFLCEWLENWPCGYLEQFADFGVGVKLRGAGEISRIPEALETFRVCDPRSLWQTIDPGRFQEILGRRAAEKMPAAV
jgi:hypothetical protein